MRGVLLVIDGIINMVLGVMLIVIPSEVVRVLGIPEVGSLFYANLLGGVLFGIGIALLLERARPPLRIVGLGLGGAISINLCGGFVLAMWLASGRLSPSMFGILALWALVLVLIGLSLIELYSHLKNISKQADSAAVRSQKAG